MPLLDALLDTLPDGEVIEVRIGLHWTAVVVDTAGERRCGLASTLVGKYNHRCGPDVPLAGRLEACSGQELAAFARADLPTLASVGVAAMNALLPRQPEVWFDANAEEMIAAYGKAKRVALIGSFPFVSRLRPRVGELIVIEREPKPDELPESAAPEVLPNADVVAITGMTVANHSLEDLLRLCAPDALVLVLGPSTPLSPVLFEHGVDMLSGAVVTAIEPVLRTIGQGAGFRQVHQAGVRLVTMQRPGLKAP